MAKIKIDYKQILVLRDPMTKIPKLVPAWEVPAYRQSFGDEFVQVLDGEVIVEKDEMPDATEELARMRALFGVEEESKQSHIDIVYGRGAEGVKNLKAAMNAAKSGDIEAAQAVADKARGYTPDKDAKAARADAYLEDPLSDSAAEPVDAPLIAGTTAAKAAARK